MSSTPRAPAGAGEAGRRLWRSVLADYELAEHELVLLRQAVRTADMCESLQGEVDRSGPLVDGRVHPGLVELRAQRLLLARLIVALRVPLGDQDDVGRQEGPGRTQRRPMRGFYGVRAVS